MIRIFYLFFCIVSFSINSKGQTFQKEGLINLVSIVAPDSPRYTWFEDSTVIFEVYQSYSESLNDSIISKGRRIYKFTILDIASMKAQDYYSFSDTATPVTNYQIKETEIISWNFYSKSHPYDKFMDSLSPISDTIIDGKQFKRFYFDLFDTSWHQRLTYYLTCSEVQNIFHLARKIDEKYPGCKVTQVQYTDMISGISAFDKLQIIRGSLNSSERNIFKKWKSNLVLSKLPITTLNEAEKEFARLFNENNP